MNNTTQPSVNSLTDLVNSFPLKDDEVVIETDDTGSPDNALIPTGIEPAKRAPYKVNVLVVNIKYVNTNGQQVWEPDHHTTRTLSITQLLQKIDRGNVMEKTGENYTVEQSRYSNTGGHPANAA